MVIPILTNISRSKGNQATKFGQSIEYMNFFFLKNYTQDVVEKLFPDPFLKTTNIEYILGHFEYILGLKF